MAWNVGYGAYAEMVESGRMSPDDALAMVGYARQAVASRPARKVTNSQFSRKKADGRCPSLFRHALSAFSMTLRRCELKDNGHDNHRVKVAGLVERVKWTTSTESGRVELEEERSA